MSFPRYPNYKNSGVEWFADVPEHWEVIRLKNVLECRITDGPHTTPEFINEGVPFLSVDGIQGGELVFEGCRYISEENYEEYRKKAQPTKNDLLMGKAASTGKIARVKTDTLFSIWSPLALIRVDSSQWSPAFYEQALKSAASQAQIEVLCTSNTQKNISMDDIPRLTLTRPPHDEQITIANFLDHETAKIDALIAEQEQLIGLLKEKRQAVISYAVTKGLNPAAPMKDSGAEWLGEVPEHWEITRLKFVKSKQKNAFVDGPFGSNLKSEHYVEDGEVLVIESGFATTGKLNESDLKRISEQHFATISRSEAREGDIIIAKIGARYGMSSILPRVSSRAVISGNSLKLTVDHEKLNIEYSHYLLLVLKACGAMDEDVNVTAQPALSLGCLNNIIFLRPPLNEQTFIVEEINKRCGKLDSLITTAYAMAETLSERRAALISAAVTGQIDVRGLDPEEEAA